MRCRKNFSKKNKFLVLGEKILLNLRLKNEIENSGGFFYEKMYRMALRKILCKKKSNQTLPVKRADREILLLIALFPEWERGMRASA